MAPLRAGPGVAAATRAARGARVLRRAHECVPRLGSGTRGVPGRRRANRRGPLCRARNRRRQRRASRADIHAGVWSCTRTAARGASASSPTTMRRCLPRASLARHRAHVRERVHELLELLRGPALEHAVAVRLVGRPSPSRRSSSRAAARGSARTCGRRARRRGRTTCACGSRPLVRASPSTITVERGSRSSTTLLEELEPDAPVVGVAGHVGDAGLGRDRAARRP